MLMGSRTRRGQNIYSASIIAHLRRHDEVPAITVRNDRGRRGEGQKPGPVPACYSRDMSKNAKAYDFLHNRKLAVLSTTGQGGRPWGAAVYYVVDEKLHIYFLTHTGSQKYENLKSQGYAAITIADDVTQTTVQAAGKVAVVEIGAEHDKAYRKLALVNPPGQFKWVPPVSKLHNGESILCRLTPDHLQLSIFDPEYEEPDVQKII